MLNLAQQPTAVTPGPIDEDQEDQLVSDQEAEARPLPRILGEELITKGYVAEDIPVSRTGETPYNETEERRRPDYSAQEEEQNDQGHQEKEEQRRGLEEEEEEEERYESVPGAREPEAHTTGLESVSEVTLERS